MSKVSIFCWSTIVSSTALILLGITFTRAEQVPSELFQALPLLHNDITELLDVRHMVLLHLPLEDAPYVLNRVQVWRHSWPLHHLQLHQQGSCHLGAVFGVLCWKTVSEGGHHLLLQNVTVHVGIHVSLNEPQLPSTSSSHAAPDHDATTTVLDYRQGSIFLVLLTRVSPHKLDTIWVKQVYLRLIRPQDMVPVIHALGQVVFSKQFEGFFCEPASESSFCDDGHANRLVGVCGIWSEHWQADLPFLQPLKQYWQHLCVCFLKPASAPDVQHKDSTSLIDPCEACSEWNTSWRTSVWPWPLYCQVLPNFL